MWGAGQTNLRPVREKTSRIEVRDLEGVWQSLGHGGRGLGEGRDTGWRIAKVLPAPLTHSSRGDTPVYLRAAGSRARSAGAALLGVRGRPGGRGGRRPGRVQYWQGKEQHCTASRPSRPPGARDPAPHRLKPDQPENRGRAGELGSPWRAERLGARKRVKGVVKGRGKRFENGRPRYPGRPLSDARALRALAL